jgi:arginyl-tRNA synthetase
MKLNYLLEISKKTSLDINSLDKLLMIPPSDKMGDLAMPCFSLAKKYKKSPMLIAEDLSKEFENSELFDKVENTKGYLNFYYNREIFTKNTLETILNKKNNLGIKPIKEGKKIVVEFSSPNVAKPFGVGHLRSTIIGNSIAKLYEKVNAKVTKINYLGDWGTQFGKLLCGFKKYGDTEELTKNPISHLNDIYVKINSNLTEKIETDSRNYFKRMEEGDNQVLSIWEKFRNLSLREFETVYGLLGVSFDDISGESRYNRKSKDIISRLKDNGILTNSQNAKIVNLKKYNLGVVILEKGDGTSIYASRDLAAAIDRYEKYEFDEMIYEVGKEQDLYFRQVFKILNLLDNNFKDKLYHVSHGLYLGNDGKKLSSRKGTSVKMEDVWNQVKDEITLYYKNSDKIPINNDLNLMTKAAIIYSDLKSQRYNDIIFDPKKVVEQNGNTGIYLLYSYARANSILKKSSLEGKNSSVPETILDEEFKLIKKFNDYSRFVEMAVNKKDPSKLANFIYDISQTFNHFYNKCKVIGVPEENFRINLVKSYSSVISDGLNLLGIDTLEKI